VLRAQAMVRRLADLGVGISWDQVAAIARRRYADEPHRLRRDVHYSGQRILRP